MYIYNIYIYTYTERESPQPAGTGGTRRYRGPETGPLNGLFNRNQAPYFEKTEGALGAQGAMRKQNR